MPEAGYLCRGIIYIIIKKFEVELTEKAIRFMNDIRND
jgi:hypothetical protein